MMKLFLQKKKKKSNELGKQIYWRYRRKNKYWQLVPCKT